MRRQNRQDDNGFSMPELTEEERDKVMKQHAGEREADAIKAYGNSMLLLSMDIFSKCGAGHDWCLQSGDTGGLAFGGYNRVFLTEKGWVASSHHCTKDFIAAFEKHGFGKVM